MNNRSENLFSALAGLIVIAVLGGSFAIFWWWSQRVETYSHTPSPTNSLSANSREAFASMESEPVERPTNSLDLELEKLYAPEGLYNYGGSTTMVPIRLVMEPFIQENYPQFQLRYTDPVGQHPGSGTGIDMLLKGQLSFSESSRPLKSSEYEAAQQRGFSLEQIPVAIDGIAIAVHPRLKLTALSIQQLADIYRGQITNWSEVGGPNLSIQPFSRLPSAGGTPEFFVENVLENETLDSRVEIVSDTTVGLRRVTENIGGIYYASAPEVVPQCSVRTLPLARNEGNLPVPPYRLPFVELSNCPEQRNQLNMEAFRDGAYPLTRRLFVIVKKNALSDEVAGRAYANILRSPEGQTLIEQAGFVRIR